MKKIYRVLTCGLLMISVACNKLVTIDPPQNQLTPDKVFDNAASINAATINMYTVLASFESNLITGIGCYTDEVTVSAVDATSVEFTNSVLTAPNSRVLSVWQTLYQTIYKANALMEGLSTTVNIPDSVINQSKGEALYLRAYAHFMLTNIYGDAPLVTTTDAAANALAERTNSSSIYNQIIADLIQSEGILPAKYTGTGEKIRVNKWAAAALLAKIYLFNKDYTKAEAQASLIISSGQYALASNLNNVFLANSSETILQLWNANGFTPLTSVPSSGKPATQIALPLFNTFELNDGRKTNWIKSTLVSGVTYYYPYKYKQRTATTGTNAEYSMQLRLADVYLIRAESRANLNNSTGAISDLNLIRVRAGLTGISFSNTAALITSILHERQVELFNEGPNRFFDLKRTGNIDAVLQVIKPMWKPAAALFPIPLSERSKDPNLSQNPGYN